FGGLTHEPAARLAQLLVELTPDGLDTVFFSDSGSVSVEVAVKMALQYWRSLGRGAKHRLMTWRGGYHGDTFTPMSVCDPDGGMHSLWTDVLAAQEFAEAVPREYDPAYSAAFEKQLAANAGSLAAVIVEPVMMNAGIIPPADGYLAEIRDLLHEAGSLLIYDEVKTGFTAGPGGITALSGVVPDIVCLAKALGGGIAAAAIGGTTQVMSAIADGRYEQVGTFNGNPLAMAATRATLSEVLTDESYA
ncbi:adenosylmethionine--8-amino-7-oxononanoate aminotransferase BioA, partial [Mycobacterium tuberculosis]|uniref:aminotransferase class III-fold pyridoxal phosphate-dependent enzyme n=1 Tax=Mycobacterium tuberculosis TaxID=1773 RepID=UPI000FE3252B